MNPVIHSENSVRKFGGEIEDYLAIHQKMDCSKAMISDNRHRALTHTLWWVNEVMIPIFGSYITLKNGRKISVKDICELHILEDYAMKFIPTPQDFLQEMEFKDWMENGKGIAPSAKKMYQGAEIKKDEDIKKNVEDSDVNIKQFPTTIPNEWPPKVYDGRHAGGPGRVFDRKLD